MPAGWASWLRRQSISILS